MDIMLNGWLLLQDARLSERKESVARLFIAEHLPKVRQAASLLECADDLVAVLPALSAHAAQGAKVWFQEATALAARQYQRDGRLRPDLGIASGPEDADISVWQFHQEFRDREFRTWTEFRTTRPVAGAYLDEVPLVQVYARPGAWR